MIRFADLQKSYIVYANDNPRVIPLLSVGKIYFVIKEIVKIAAVQPQSCERNIIGRFADTQEARVARGHALTHSYAFFMFSNLLHASIS